MKVYLVTKNKGKLLAAQTTFAGSDVELLNVEHDYDEIQADTSLEIARHTSIQAAKELSIPAVREDHSVFLAALNGLPGPYMSYFFKKMNEKDVLNIYKNMADRRGYFEVATVLAYPDGKTIENIFRVNFVLSKEARGNLQTGINRLIILEGETRTIAEYEETERVHIWNQGYLHIKNVLSQTS